MFKRFLILSLLLSVLTAVTGFVLAQEAPSADPFPDCDPGYEFAAEVSNLRPQVGETIVYTATITNRTGQDQPHVEVGVGFGTRVWIIESFTMMMDGEAGYASTTVTPGMPGSMYNTPYVAQFDMNGQPICLTVGDGLDIQVGTQTYLPIISR